jgi:hypothetical protein
LQLVAAMIGPDRANREAFTLAHREPGAPADEPAAFALAVERSGRPEVRRGVPHPTTTIVCEPERLITALGGLPGPGFQCHGAPAPLGWVQRRMKLAESG